MFPTNSERLIGISEPFLPFSSLRAHCTPNKSVPTLRYTRRHGLIYKAMPVGIYRVQSPGFPKIVYSHGIFAHLPTKIAPISLVLSPPSVQFVIVRVLILPKKHIASNHDLKHHTRPPRVKSQFRLHLNNVGFICAA